MTQIKYPTSPHHLADPELVPFEGRTGPGTTGAAAPAGVDKVAALPIILKLGATMEPVKAPGPPPTGFPVAAATARVTVLNDAMVPVGTRATGGITAAAKATAGARKVPPA
jgi:hypothetical protein